MAGFKYKKEQSFVIIDMQTYGHSNTIVLQNDEETRVPGSNVSPLEENPSAAQVACHFFFPIPDDTDEGDVPKSGQQDPLAVTKESVDCSANQANFNTVDDEITTLNNLPRDSDFSIIDPLGIVDPDIPLVKMEPTAEAVDVKPSAAQLEEVTGKRKSLFECDLNQSASAKKMKSEAQPYYSNIGLKNLVVNIGPKLPLPQCFQRNACCKKTSNLVKTPQKIIECGKRTFGETSPIKLHPKEHIVLKIYTCTKCNYKCTDPTYYDVHVASCDSTDTTNSELRKSNFKNGFYLCEFCSYKFSKEQNLVVHESQHYIGKSFHCHICGMNFPTVQRVRVHANKCHKGLTKVFTCNLCDYSSVSCSHLRDHMITHNKDKYMYCWACKKNLEDLDEYNDHQLTKHNKTCVKKKVVRRNFNEIDKTKQQSSESNRMLKLKSSFESEIVEKKGLYYCNGCLFRFSNLASLMTHKKQHLNVEKPYRCSKCAHESLSVLDMTRHSRTHSRKMTAVCNLCSLSLKDWKWMKDHAIRHVYDGLFCTKCRINFDDAVACREHMLSVHKQASMYSCNKCSFIHSSIKVFKKHLKLHISNKNGFSQKESKDNDEAMQQKENAFNVKKEQIPNLSVSFTESVNVESGRCKNDIFKCEICRLKFSNRSALKNHNKTHLSQKLLISSDKQKMEKEEVKFMFKCCKCNDQFPQISSFVEHNRYSHGEQFVCNICNRKSVLLKTYIHHIKSHLKTALYFCCYCNFNSECEQNFVQHITDHELKCCPMCVFRTQRIQELKDHVDKQHKPGREPFSCGLCPYNSRFESGLSVHSLKCHPKEYTKMTPPLLKRLKSHACSICPFRSYRKYDLKKHVDRHYANEYRNKRGHKQASYELHKNKIKNKSQLTKYIDDSVKQMPKSKNGKMLTTVDVSKDFYYSCSQCEYKKKNRKSVANHLHDFHNIIGGVRNNMILKVSGILSPQKRRIVLKSRSRTTNLKYDESVKSHRIKTKESISRNLTNHKIGTTSIAQNVECTKCDVHKMTKIAQADHEKCGHEVFWKKPFQCSKCGLRFYQKFILNRHEKKHGKSTLNCQLCNNYVTYRTDTMKIHRKICTGPYKQIQTTKKSLKNPNLQMNRTKISKVEEREESNSDDDSYSCGECSYVTSDVTDLIKHMFIHSGIPDD